MTAPKSAEQPLRAALFLDFDNVVSGLVQGAGAETALRFASDPEAWMPWLAADHPRRWLVRRCYMNPAGYIEDANGYKHYYSRFRPRLMGAGFEVQDCPRLTRFKNAADLRIVIDAMDLLSSPVFYEEFTLISSDSDFVPLLLRLRAADRRTRLLAHPAVGRAVRGATDSVLGLDELAQTLGWLERDGFGAGEDDAEG